MWPLRHFFSVKRAVPRARRTTEPRACCMHVCRYNQAQESVLHGAKAGVTSSLMAAPPLPQPHQPTDAARDRIKAKVLGSKAGLFGGFLNERG